jgi:hypothetical protein
MVRRTSEPEEDHTMHEPQSAQTNDVPMAGVAPDATSRFERGMDMEELYGLMRPDQRTAIAGEFIRLLSLTDDRQAEQFRRDFQEHMRLTGSANDELLSVEQAVAVDRYVRQKHPEMIGQMLRHPVTQSALAMAGAQPVEEQNGSSNYDAMMPPESVATIATSGAAYATSWETIEQGNEEANRLAEDPYKHGATPGGDTE